MRTQYQTQSSSSSSSASVTSNARNTLINPRMRSTSGGSITSTGSISPRMSAINSQTFPKTLSRRPSTTSRTRTRVMTDFVERGDILWHLEVMVSDLSSNSEQLVSTLILSAMSSCSTYTLRMNEAERREERPNINGFYLQKDYHARQRSAWLNTTVATHQNCVSLDASIAASDACINIILQSLSKGFEKVSGVDWLTTAGWFRWLT